ncbi:hypothetical protein WMF37_51500 [Sorangium sp. So ce291]|uniref:hypothetical protein n=1 Tax=Sorangium sp. So ce291 TaxID=3133294 RepID=UPI003F5FA3A3
MVRSADALRHDRAGTCICSSIESSRSKTSSAAARRAAGRPSREHVREADAAVRVVRVGAVLLGQPVILVLLELLERVRGLGRERVNIVEAHEVREDRGLKKP